MDLSQKKLKKEEWEAIEVPLPQQEKEILALIQQGYDDVNVKQNTALSIMTFMKIKNNRELYHHYFYDIYFSKKIAHLIKKNRFSPYDKKKIKKLNLKKLIK